MEDRFKFEQDEKVSFTIGKVKVLGLIKGCGGYSYIVKVTDGFIPNKDYPYDTAIVSEWDLKKVKCK